MLMGLTGAPSTFAEMMSTHLHNFIADGTMELFVNNGACAADSYEEMIEKLKHIFQRCQKWKLLLSPTKCWLFMTETTFASATIGPKGIQPDLAKLTAIVSWEQPPDALNLESFLGLTSHFSDLIQSYSTREGPLHNLVKAAPLIVPYMKNSYQQILWSFKLHDLWADKHTTAFLDLKAALVSKSIL
jgi:hypothetical protein